MTELTISPELQIQLDRVKKIGACTMNQPLKVELSAINEELFGFKLNTFCKTCVLDAMHKVNQHVDEQKEDAPKTRILEVSLPENQYSEAERNDLKKMFEESRPGTILNIVTFEGEGEIEFKVVENGTEKAEVLEEEHNVFNPFIEVKTKIVHIHKPEGDISEDEMKVLFESFVNNMDEKDIEYKLSEDEGQMSIIDDGKLCILFDENGPVMFEKEEVFNNETTKKMKAIEVYTKAELKKMNLSDLQELAEKVNAKFKDAKIPEIKTKGQGVKDIAGKPKI